jgi:hypothetical protein
MFWDSENDDKAAGVSLQRKCLSIIIIIIIIEIFVVLS